MNLKEYMIKERYSARHLGDAIGISKQHAYQISRGQVYASEKVAEQIQKWTKNKVKAHTLMKPKVCHECGRPYPKKKVDIITIPPIAA